MSKAAEFAVILKMNPMFADLGADELARISSLCHTQHLTTGEMLFQKGDPGDALFGVRRGQIRIETGASDGSRLTLNFMGPGDLFGEVAVLDGFSRTADATAGEPTELFVLRRDDFLSHLEREPKVAIKIIMLLCQRIRWFLIAEVFPRIRGPLPNVRLVVVGGMSMPPGFVEFVAEQNLRLGGSVRLLGHQPDVGPALAAADVVVGAGRSAIEALASGRPVVALGETNFVGVVSEETAAEAVRTNFGDTGTREPPDAARVATELIALLQDSGRREALAPWGRTFVERNYDAAATWRRVEGIYRQARALSSPRRIPVLMYHRIVEKPPVESHHGTWVTAERLAGQLDALVRRRFTTITFRDYADYLAGDTPLPPKPILLTFDDGYADNYTLAMPLLRERGMRAAVFLIGDARITTNVWDAAEGEPILPLLNRAQIREMAAQGVEFGSHTRSHARLAGLAADRLRVEVAGSKRAIEERVGAPAVALCYPWGAVDAAAKQAVADAGYAFGVASDSGPLRIGEDLL